MEKVSFITSLHDVLGLSLFFVFPKDSILLFMVNIYFSCSSNVHNIPNFFLQCNPVNVKITTFFKLLLPTFIFIFTHFLFIITHSMYCRYSTTSQQFHFRCTDFNFAHFVYYKIYCSQITAFWHILCYIFLIQRFDFVCFSPGFSCFIQMLVCPGLFMILFSVVTFSRV